MPKISTLMKLAILKSTLLGNYPHKHVSQTGTGVAPRSVQVAIKPFLWPKIPENPKTLDTRNTPNTLKTLKTLNTRSNHPKHPN